MPDERWPDMLSIPNVVDEAKRAAHRAAERLYDGLMTHFRDAATQGCFGSPIEAIFFAHFAAIVELRDLRFHLSPQHTVTCGERNYRLDFAVFPSDTDMVWEAHVCGAAFPMTAIELDGHDFHERTKDQVAYRDQRDRDLQVAGWRVLHYSGSVLNRDPSEAAENAYAACHDAWTKSIEKVRAAKNSEWLARERKRQV